MGNALQHHGILGMKWGVRRYQNKDGSLTSVGKKHAKASSMSDEELVSKLRRLNLEAQYNKLSKDNSKTSKLDTSKKIVDATSTIINQLKSSSQDSIDKKPKNKLDLSSMTDQQLRDKINRENLELQYNKLFGKNDVTVSKGRSFAMKSLAIGGAILTAGSSALSIALAIKELKKG